ncbi:DUF5667 domain-containing protein [Clostridium sp. A1-XYC3]|uniref:DUF5667 domain-containing protein n=1 Tax=Clostridium tanneri TaxID=3037988 RepID=A0ABU4JVV8_9CLOT|nr:DUF5667 domain-containing protein [Clostridium sp. A1-XYC3]MDW8802303.1 DUF5667 domain-containing protein [Clostridium sp. A1-XYC3]
MKKLILFITALTVSLNITGKVLADGSVETLKEQAGVTPDSTILYPIDKAIDNIKINLSTGENKAEVLIEVAEERLGESEVMAEKEKTDLSNEAINDYNNKMNDAVDKVQETVEKTTVDKEQDSEKLDKLKNLEEKISERQEKSIEVLKNLQSKLPDKAKETIALVIEMQTAKKEAIIAVAKERQALIEEKKAVKEAEKKLEEIKKSGNAEEIKIAENTLKEKQEALTAQKEKFSKIVAEKKEVMKGGVGQLKKQLKAEVKNGTITKEEGKEAVKAAESIKEDSKVLTNEQLKASNSEASKDSSKTLNSTGNSSTAPKAVNNTGSVEINVKVEKEHKDEKKDKKEKIKENKKENKDKDKEKNED